MAQIIISSTSNSREVIIPTNISVSLQDLLAYVDYQLGTRYADEFVDECTACYNEGFEVGSTPEDITDDMLSYEHDYGALDRIRTAEVTGYVPS